jgi:hypothetical protein
VNLGLSVNATCTTSETWVKILTVNPVGPVFHLFSSGNPDFIIYMDELKADEFGMTF